MYIYGRRFYINSTFTKISRKQIRCSMDVTVTLLKSFQYPFGQLLSYLIQSMENTFVHLNLTGLSSATASWLYSHCRSNPNRRLHNLFILCYKYLMSSHAPNNMTDIFMLATLFLVVYVPCRYLVTKHPHLYNVCFVILNVFLECLCLHRLESTEVYCGPSV